MDSWYDVNQFLRDPPLFFQPWGLLEPVWRRMAGRYVEKVLYCMCKEKDKIKIEDIASTYPCARMKFDERNFKPYNLPYWLRTRAGWSEIDPAIFMVEICPRVQIAGGVCST